MSLHTTSFRLGGRYLGEVETGKKNPQPAFSPDLIKSLSLLSPLWFFELHSCCTAGNNLGSMLIFGQNEMKDSVEWKARAESLGLFSILFPAVEGEKPKEDVLERKKNLQTIGFGTDT